MTFSSDVKEHLRGAKFAPSAEQECCAKRAVARTAVRHRGRFRDANWEISTARGKFGDLGGCARRATARNGNIRTSASGRPHHFMLPLAGIQAVIKGSLPIMTSSQKGQ